MGLVIEEVIERLGLGWTIRNHLENGLLDKRWYLALARTEASMEFVSKGVAVTRDGFARTGSKAIWCKKYFERVYTTKLERGPQTRQLEKEAMRRAREIEGEDTHDLHLAEERGLHLHDNFDIVEVIRYSLVCRGSRVDDSGYEEHNVGFPQHGDFGESSGSLGKRPVDLTNLQSIDGAQMMTSSSLGEAQTSQATIGADLNHFGSNDQARQLASELPSKSFSISDSENRIKTICLVNMEEAVMLKSWWKSNLHEPSDDLQLPKSAVLKQSNQRCFFKPNFSNLQVEHQLMKSHVPAIK
ncbi:hypothetical protein COLO4_14248, partial [Corchorus olitorius]